MKRPMLNIKAPSLPYKMERDSDNEGFYIRDVGRKGEKNIDNLLSGIFRVDHS